MSDDGFDQSTFVNNPYRPTNVGRQMHGESLSLPPGQTRGMTGHTTVLGVLMVVQGVFDFLAGIMVGVYAWFMPELFMQMQAEAAKRAAQNGGAAPQGMPPDMGMYIAIGGGIIAAVLVLIGVLLIYSGIGVTSYRRRGLAIASLLLGVLTLMTCYCFPTSLILGVYGLIVLFNQSVTLAFHLRGEGNSATDIQRAFLSPPSYPNEPANEGS
ncbi:hypothetical protein [Planctomycetes bacterium K23_9]|uniref:DUF4064 domain-containing protein n=1 Tax=Stieleria marina TaxID=1930275 RepID=A0A517NZ99_9BACT|nr:hypothetical protein K239x_44570 [Planctomycetes bacterium K23_9]